MYFGGTFSEWARLRLERKAAPEDREGHVYNCCKLELGLIFLLLDGLEGQHGSYRSRRGAWSCGRLGDNRMMSIPEMEDLQSSADMDWVTSDGDLVSIPAELESMVEEFFIRSVDPLRGFFGVQGVLPW